MATEVWLSSEILVLGELGCGAAAENHCAEMLGCWG